MRHYVRALEQRQNRVDGAVLFPLAARPEQFLEFYLWGEYQLRSCGAADEVTVPSAVVVGPSTWRRADLVLRGSLTVFTIQFQPCGFHLLFRVPMPELTDQGLDARSILGPELSELHERLANAPDFSARTGLATTYLLKRLAEVRRPDPVAHVASLVRSDGGALHIGAAAASSGLSIRQFERRFLGAVGVAPKRYARIVRFQAALQAKLDVPSRHWTEIAHDLGYHDQMHMVHDFHSFAGETPTEWHARLNATRRLWS